MRSLLLIGLALLAPATAAQGTFLPIGTSPSGAGLDGNVTAVVAAPGGQFYVAGEFHWAGDGPAERVALWDGNAWHFLPGLSREPLSQGLALAALSDGSVVAGGDIRTAGGVPAGGVARWDGSAWSPLGTLLSQTGDRVWNLHVDAEGTLHALGRLSLDGGQATSVARWTGMEWEAVVPAQAGIPRVITTHPEHGLTGAGLFPLEGGGSEYRVGIWNGSAWDLLPGAVIGSDRTVRSLEWLSGGRLLMSGTFESVGGVVARGLASWDGNEWRPVGTSGLLPAGVVGEVRQQSSGDLLTVGRFSDGMAAPVWALARWDGATWTTLGAAMDAAVLHLDQDEAGRVMVGGQFSAVGELASPRAAVFDGGLWRGVGSAVDGTVNALVTASDGSVFAGGEFGVVPDLVTGPVARWDGAAWHAVGGLAGDVWALAAGANGAVLAAGYLTNGGGGQPGCASRWDGTVWQPLGSTCGSLDEIYAAAMLPDGTPVVGGRDYGLGPAVVHWDGEAWAGIGGAPDSLLGGNVWALAVAPNGRLFAGGEHLWTEGAALPSCVARWTGSRWRSVGTNLRSASTFGDCVWALAFGSDGSLYAGGYFYVGDDPAVHGVARWDGSTWTAIPSSAPTYSVWALAFGSDGRLYAGGGAFTVWNGSDWEVLSTSGTVYALAPDAAGRLVAGGFFHEMGGITSSNVVGYSPPPVASEPTPTNTTFAVFPNPTAGPATIRTAAGGRAEVLDALGRTLWSGDVAPGTTDLPTAGLAPGVYVVRLTGGGEVASQRLVVGR